MNIDFYYSLVVKYIYTQKTKYICININNDKIIFIKNSRGYEDGYSDHDCDCYDCHDSYDSYNNPDCDYDY